jgi:hypothetical protein
MQKDGPFEVLRLVSIAKVGARKICLEYLFRRLQISEHS